MLIFKKISMWSIGKFIEIKAQKYYQEKFYLSWFPLHISGNATWNYA